MVWARRWCMIAPAKTSLAEALPWFISTTTGTSRATPPDSAFQSRRSPCPSSWYSTSPSSMNWPVTSTTAETRPPGLLRMSTTRPNPWERRNRSIARCSSSLLVPLKDVIRKCPMRPTSIFSRTLSRGMTPRTISSSSVSPEPSRRTSSRTMVSFSPRMRLTTSNSSSPTVLSPSISRMTSRGRTPALSAGVSGMGATMVTRPFWMLTSAPMPSK